MGDNNWFKKIKNKRNLLLQNIIVISSLFLSGCQIRNIPNSYITPKQPSFENMEDIHDFLHAWVNLGSECCRDNKSYLDNEYYKNTSSPIRIYYRTTILYNYKGEVNSIKRRYIGTETRTIDNFHSENTVTETIATTREWSKETYVNYTELNKVNFEAGTNIFSEIFIPTIKSSIEKILSKETSIKNSEKNAYENTVVVNVSPNTKTKIKFKWYQIWQHGLIKLELKTIKQKEIVYFNLPQILKIKKDKKTINTKTINLPYKVLIGISFDKQLRDLKKIRNIKTLEEQETS